jgi:Flp pilus assembly protein protease CpaA
VTVYLISDSLAANTINVVLAAGLAYSVYTDVRWGKIFNKVTFPLILAGLFLNTLFAGPAGSLESLKGFGAAIGLALLLTLIAGPGLGGGDIKLLAAIGALCGPRFVLWTCLFTALAGSVIFLVPLVRQGILLYTVRNFAGNVYRKYVLQLPVDVAEGSRGGKQPFSVAILAGVILAFVKLASP